MNKYFTVFPEKWGYSDKMALSSDYTGVLCACLVDRVVCN